MWTRPYGGMNAEYWVIPTNKPVYGPRYLAEQIKKCTYHRLIMQNIVTESNRLGQVYGSMAVESTIQRLDAYPVNTRKSIFMSV